MFNNIGKSNIVEGETGGLPDSLAVRLGTKIVPPWWWKQPRPWGQTFDVYSDEAPPSSSMGPPAL